ncbi:Protein O-linked-mannose beta-1,4-N-acetylglucosaminyltransferase 2 [Holothuria leucospilota]|uniref:Protein O-linked-mannose beta-1,4-N-acetylglucosaminyltransferase 2 n=1 Tax=Holothuria leucospilota TaxID=206669 RepID=A0A9Q0YLF2_HOLLE|nr:Protein O-linked-mannose beta-1,4-N-acetylglucosaminyltransferase 2 [Holothuria leucospilota]
MEWCKGDVGVLGENDVRICNFRNLCYSNFYDLYLVDKQFRFDHVVHLTTIAGMTDLFSYFEIPTDHIMMTNHLRLQYKRGKFSMFSRMATSNIAHDIHDVLMPLFYTLMDRNELYQKPSRTIIALFEDMEIESAQELHHLLSKETPITKLQLSFQSDETLTCFEDVTVGLLKTSVWYQWGFQLDPKGPIVDAGVTSQHIRKFTGYVMEHLNLTSHCSGEIYGILFSRKLNRKILNDKELANAVSEKFNIKIVELSMEVNSLSYIIETVSCAKLVMGIHGAMLILAMFLPPSSVLLEMYPYAINPAHLTPYITMALLPGMDIEYVRWRNMNSSASLVSKKGNFFRIDHLSHEEREAILNSTEAPRRPCCKNSELRFRLYHNTIVNISEVLDILSSTSLITSPREHPISNIERR